MATYKSHLDIGETAWGIEQSYFRPAKVCRLTVRRVEIIDSGKGKCTEQYMCDETGVGSGSIWTYGVDIFATKKAAEKAVARNKI